MRWDINPKIGCGALKFGMRTTEVSELLGAPDKVKDGHMLDIAERRINCPWEECAYSSSGLERLSANLMMIGQLYLFGTNLLNIPLMSAIEQLGDRNGGICQAQGGSLYFDQLGIAILQFEEARIRELLLFSSRYNHHEPLRHISLTEVEKYYVGDIGRNANKDRLGIRN